MRPVYNLTVDETHTFFVGDGDWLVHNHCPNPNQFTEDQVALQDLVNERTHGGRRALPVDEAEIIIDWAQETNYPGFRASIGDVSSPSNWNANPVPHIHLPGTGRGGHVPVQPGVTPR